MSWITWIFIGLIIAVVLYAISSMLLKKPIGLYIAAALHIVLGIMSLPSIGLFVFGLAIIEIIIGIRMNAKSR